MASSSQMILDVLIKLNNIPILGGGFDQAIFQMAGQSERLRLKDKKLQREGVSALFNLGPDNIPKPPPTATEIQSAMMSMPDQNMSVPIVIQSTIELDGEAVGTASQEVISSRMGNGDLMNSALPTNSAKLR